MLTEAQLAALEKAKTEKEEFESEHPGYCGAQDTFYVGNLKGVGRVYQQTFIDTYAKVACVKLYDRKTSRGRRTVLNGVIYLPVNPNSLTAQATHTRRPTEGCFKISKIPVSRALLSQ